MHMLFFFLFPSPMLGMEPWTSYMVLQRATTEPQHATPALHTHFHSFMCSECVHMCVWVFVEAKGGCWMSYSHFSQIALSLTKSGAT